MASVNKVMLVGNLTRDPEVRYTPKGSAVADIGLAINRYYNTESGEKREETTFVDITLWGRLAEIAEKYCHKGKPVFIEGRLQLDSWEDKATGQKRNKLKVVGENLQLLGSAGDSGPGGGSSNNQGNNYASQENPSQSSQPSQSAPATALADEVAEDDIPF